MTDQTPCKPLDTKLVPTSEVALVDLMPLSQIAQNCGAEIHQARYIVKKLGITAVLRVGMTDLFSVTAANQIQQQFATRQQAG